MNPFRNDFEWKSHFGTIDTSGCLIYVLNRKNFHNYWIMLATISGVILFISEGVLFHWDCCRSLGLLQICGIAADLWGGIAADHWGGIAADLWGGIAADLWDGIAADPWDGCKVTGMAAGHWDY